MVEDPVTTSATAWVADFLLTSISLAKRVKYIQAIASGFPAAVEYDYSSGPVLGRVSRMLTPVQASEYQTALSGIR